MNEGEIPDSGPAKSSAPSVSPVVRSWFLSPKGWDAREYLYLLALLCMLIATVALSWVRVDVDFKDPLLGVSWFKGQYSFKVLENGALSSLIIIMLALSLAVVFLRKPWDWAGPLLSFGLLACSGYYLLGLADKAYDALGFLDSLLAVVRKAIPVIGPVIADLTRQAVLDSIKSVRPQAGLFLFLGGNLLLLATSALRLLRKQAPFPTSPPPPFPASGPGV